MFLMTFGTRYDGEECVTGCWCLYFVRLVSLDTHLLTARL